MYVRTLAISLFFSFADANLLSHYGRHLTHGERGRGHFAAAQLLQKDSCGGGGGRAKVRPRLPTAPRPPVENLTKVVSPDERSLNVERKYLPSKASEASSNTAS